MWEPLLLTEDQKNTTGQKCAEGTLDASDDSCN